MPETVLVVLIVTLLHACNTQIPALFISSGLPLWYIIVSLWLPSREGTDHRHSITKKETTT